MTRDPTTRLSLVPKPEAGGGEPPDECYLLRLYIGGETPKSLAAIANLRALCEAHLPGAYEIELVDLTKTPELAAADQIIALPTLVRRRPPPLKRVIGSLSDAEKVLDGLVLPKAPK